MESGGGLRLVRVGARLLISGGKRREGAGRWGIGWGGRVGFFEGRVV